MITGCPHLRYLLIGVLKQITSEMVIDILTTGVIYLFTRARFDRNYALRGYFDLSFIMYTILSYLDNERYQNTVY